jgi:cytochrome c-type biogenesis protein CcmI
MSSADLVPSILGIVLVAAAAAFVLLPFARGARAEVSPAPVEGDKPDRFALYQQVLELDFDRQLGKLSAEDYDTLSAELLAEAGQALRQERGAIGEIDQEIEREIAAARAAFAAARQGGPAAKPARRRRKPAGTPVVSDR